MSPIHQVARDDVRPIIAGVEDFLVPDGKTRGLERGDSWEDRLSASHAGEIDVVYVSGYNKPEILGDCL